MIVRRSCFAEKGRLLPSHVRPSDNFAPWFSASHLNGVWNEWIRPKGFNHGMSTAHYFKGIIVRKDGTYVIFLKSDQSKTQEAVCKSHLVYSVPEHGIVFF